MCILHRELDLNVWANLKRWREGRGRQPEPVNKLFMYFGQEINSVGNKPTEFDTSSPMDRGLMHYINQLGFILSSISNVIFKWLRDSFMCTHEDSISSLLTLLEQTHQYGWTMHVMHCYQSAPPLEPPPLAYSVQTHTSTHKHTLLGGLGHRSSLAGRVLQGG